jgi:murein tripeptide amidase MpaA
LLARFVEELVFGYGENAEITTIMERTEIHAILYVNPDGRWMAVSR